MQHARVVDISAAFVAKLNMANSGTQTESVESLKKRMNLIALPLQDSTTSVHVPEGMNPMHVISLNPKTKKGKTGPPTPNVLKRRLSVSGDEPHLEKFTRLARFGSGLKRKISASTRDLMEAMNSSGVSTNPRDDTTSISSKSSIKRSLSSSMRDLFGGSFTKIDKEVRERGGKSEERKKDKTLKHSPFVIGGGITFGRSAGRRAAAGLRDSFRDILPKLRVTRVFEMNVVLPDGTQTKVSSKHTSVILILP